MFGKRSSRAQKAHAQWVTLCIYFDTPFYNQLAESEVFFNENMAYTEPLLVEMNSGMCLVGRFEG